jgi:hypothetical protein
LPYSRDNESTASDVHGIETILSIGGDLFQRIFLYLESNTISLFSPQRFVAPYGEFCYAGLYVPLEGDKQSDERAWWWSFNVTPKFIVATLVASAEKIVIFGPPCNVAIGMGTYAFEYSQFSIVRSQS